MECDGWSQWLGARRGRKAEDIMLRVKPTNSLLWQKPLRKLFLLTAQRIVISLEDLPTSLLELKNTLQKQLTVTFMCL